MANLAVTDDSNLCKNNYYYALASEYVRIPPLIFHLATLALPTLVPAASTSLPTPQLPITTPSPQRLASVLPMVAPNTRWPAPLSPRHPPSLRRQCQDILCRPSRTPSSAWVPLLTTDAPLSSPPPMSWSTIPMDIQSLQAGVSKMARASGTSRSPNKEHKPRLRLPSQHRWEPSRRHPCNRRLRHSCPSPHHQDQGRPRPSNVDSHACANGLHLIFRPIA